MLSGKRIILGVSGGIAAYKTVELARLLKKNGADVQVILTEDAAHFVSSKSLSVVTGRPVLSSFWDEKEQWNNHVKLGLWADLLLLAPATANTLAKMCHGLCDNLLLATYLSNRSQTVVCPAMDLDMWEHPSVQSNITTLAQRHTLIGPESGELASGLVGKGRMTNPEDIVQQLDGILGTGLSLDGKTVMLTAGPTVEAIDPVRYITNHSSGKMGFALATELGNKGAKVHLVAGPTHLTLDHPNVEIHHVQSAQDMFEACKAVWDQCDAGIFAAAVADYTPKVVADQKIKKKESSMTMEFTKTVDILKHFGHAKDKQLVVGFALETENEEANAQAKLKNKQCDFLVLNSTRNEGTTFGSDHNKVIIFDAKGKVFESEKESKRTIAQRIIETVFTQE